MWELLNLLNLVLELIDILINLLSTACDLLKIGSKNGIELLDVFMSCSKVLQHGDHILWLRKDFLEALELPLLYRLLILNLFFGVDVFILPLLKNFNTLSDKLKGHLRSLHLENFRDVDLSFDFLANLKRNTSKNLFKLVFLSVDVTRNCPNKLKAG